MDGMNQLLLGHVGRANRASLGEIEVDEVHTIVTMNAGSWNTSK